MNGCLGSHEHQIDQEGRLSLPAAFRRGAEGRPLVLVQVHDGALSLYPQAARSKVEARPRHLLRLQPDARPHVPGVTANAQEVHPDRQGRVLIPQRLLAAVGPRQPPLVVGVIARIAIRDPARSRAMVAQAVGGAARFAAQVFG